MKEHVWKTQGIKESPTGQYEEFVCECGAKYSKYPEVETEIKEYYFDTKSSEYCDEGK